MEEHHLLLTDIKVLFSEFPTWAILTEASKEVKIRTQKKIEEDFLFLSAEITAQFNEPLTLPTL